MVHAPGPANSKHLFVNTCHSTTAYNSTAVHSNYTILQSTLVMWLSSQSVIQNKKSSLYVVFYILVLLTSTRIIFTVSNMTIYVVKYEVLYKDVSILYHFVSERIYTP